MENVFLVLTLLKVMVCLRCSLQMMHFFLHLKHPSVSWSCSGSCGFCVGVLDGISIFLVVAIPFTHDRWRWYCLSHS